MRHIPLTLTLLLSLLMLPCAAGASADSPLMLIRFNQPRVYFQEKLTSVVAQVKAAKPQAQYSVVSYAPVTGDDDLDAQWKSYASLHTQEVVRALKSAGVADEQLHITGQEKLGIPFDETAIYVY